jgi:hypothetical protein
VLWLKAANIMWYINRVDTEFFPVNKCFGCMFCRSLFVLLSFFFWSLCCLSFVDLQILITPLAPPDCSYTHDVLLYYNNISTRDVYWYKLLNSIDILQIN